MPNISDRIGSENVIKVLSQTTSVSGKLIYITKYLSNIVIEQGFSFKTFFHLINPKTDSELDLTGSSVESKIRKNYGNSTYVSFASSIILPATSGIISLALTANQTTTLTPGRYVYDVKISYDNSGENVFKVVEGSALVRSGVSI